MANKKTGGTRLTGINPLSYLGVEPYSPPELVRFQIAPTNRDFNFNIGDLWLVESPFEVWMLLEKPQNVAFWALIYPQGGAGGGISLIHTGGPDVEGDVNGAISILGGENINTTASGPNTLIINLNRTIVWPDTNSSGTEGVIYLNGDRFLHNFGDGGGNDFNTFLGIQSGDFALTNTATSNTGIGALSLTLLTEGSRNTAVGAEALSEVTIGVNNIALGRAAGDNVVSGSNNIHIGNRGASADADSSTIRIGTETVQLETHIAGIFGQTVLGTVTPNTVLNVDDTGQIGQLELTSSGATIAITQPSNGVINLEAIGGGGGGGSNPFSFSYVQVGDTVGFVSGTNYSMGASIALTKLFDVGNNFSPGNGLGTPAHFTAPVTGKYYFEYLIMAKGTASGTFVTGLTQQIITSPGTTRTYNSRELPGTADLLYQYSLVTDMTMNDTAVFNALNIVTPDSSNYFVSGNGGAIGTSNINSTRISGFLIPEGASGGNFSQPFYAEQQVDTNVDVVGGLIGPYALGGGGAAPLVELFDVGSNFDGGNGAGTAATFIAPATGIYSFTISYFTNIGSVTGEGCAIFVNGVQSGSAAGTTNASVFDAGYQREFIRSLTVGDIVTFLVNSRSSSNPAITGTVKVSLNPVVVGLTCNAITYVSGYRIA